MKIIGIILILLMLILVGVYIHFVRELDKHNLIIKPPPKAKNEKPVIYRVGWWAFQDKLKIEDFKVEMLENRVNLSNSKSLAAYTVSGQIEKGYYIKEVHMSQRIAQIDDDRIKSYRIINITPIVEALQKENVEDGFEAFSFTNQDSISSNNWGKNNIQYICGDFEQHLSYNQGK